LAGCHFCCSQYVLYECLCKKPNKPKPSFEELKKRLVREQSRGQFREIHLDVDDLQSVDALRNRKRLSMGELASMVLAKRIGQAFLSDDQKAQKLAEDFLDPKMVQTTPHLLGWLVFSGVLVDGDIPAIVTEHETLQRPLAARFDEEYREAMRCRRMHLANDI